MVNQTVRSRQHWPSWNRFKGGPLPILSINICSVEPCELIRYSYQPTSKQLLKSTKMKVKKHIQQLVSRYHTVITIESRREKPWLLHANNKSTDQTAHPRSLISAFVIRLLQSIVANILSSMPSLNVQAILHVCRCRKRSGSLVECLTR